MNVHAEVVYPPCVRACFVFNLSNTCLSKAGCAKRSGHHFPPPTHFFHDCRMPRDMEEVSNPDHSDIRPADDAVTKGWASVVASPWRGPSHSCRSSSPCPPPSSHLERLDRPNGRPSQHAHKLYVGTLMTVMSTGRWSCSRLASGSFSLVSCPCASEPLLFCDGT